MSNDDQGIKIEGTTAPGFESVKILYEHMMQTLAERNTQLCVYYQGERVVDLWGSAVNDRDFTPDSLVNIFSSGKSLETIAIASLVSKGLLKYDAKIAEYWPEFAAEGKQSLTVADLMRHEAGLAAFNTSIDPKDLLPENIKQNKIGKIIEAHPQKYRDAEGSRREYHAITRGWIANEVFRRLDPAGRTMGEFLQEDISGPMNLDANIGLKESQLSRVSKVHPLSMGYQFRQSFRPRFLGRKMERNVFQTISRFARLLPNLRNSTTRGTPPPFIGMDRIAFFNEPAIAMGETPSANANCSARGLAKLAAMMSLGGKWEGIDYLSDAAWTSLHANPVKADMGFMTTTFTQGGVAQFNKTGPNSPALESAFNTGREGFYGWMGLGGSLFQWHPEKQIGLGYVPTSLNVLDLFNERGKAYQAEVLRCVERLGG